MDKLKVLTLLALAPLLSGCIPPQQQYQPASVQVSAPRGGGAALTLCIAPATLANGGTHSWSQNRLREVTSVDAAEGCDVVLTSSHQDQGWNYYPINSQAISVHGRKALWSDVQHGDWSPAAAINKVINRYQGAFAPGSNLFTQISAEKRAAGGLAERPKLYADAARQAEIKRLEQEGDAAAASGKRGEAFAAYSRALNGVWSDDEVSDEVRSKLLKLVSTYRSLPELPEEARRRMARAKALAASANGAQDYDQAAGEMMAAIAWAPYWWDAYYNLALLQDKQGYLRDSVANLKLYLLANPNGADARAVQDKVYGLEARLEKAGN